MIKASMQKDVIELRERINQMEIDQKIMHQELVSLKGMNRKVDENIDDENGTNYKSRQRNVNQMRLHTESETLQSKISA